MISTDVQQAVKQLNEGGIVAIPTETVYGLAGNIFDKKAIRKIFEIKQRPLFNPLIVHLSDRSALSDIVEYIPQKAKVLANYFWPGPLTLLLEKKSVVPDLITAGSPKVAVRVPRHKIAREVLQQLNFPLAAPSANPFTKVSPTTAQHVYDYFGESVPCILDGGECQEGLESTIVGFEDDSVLVYRLGAVSCEELEEVIGPVQIKTSKGKVLDAPGMLVKHYAPRTPLLFTKDIQKAIEESKCQKIGVLTLKRIVSAEIKKDFGAICLSATGSMEEAAANLYASLHILDNKNLDVIIAEELPDSGLGRTINDKLKRASFR